MLNEVKMKKRSFILNVFFLTTATLIARIIGIIFRVYMSNKIGSEGIGLYQLITTIYFFSATFSTSGISLAVTRLVTDSIAKKEFKAVKFSLIRCLYIGIILSSIIGFILFKFSTFLSISILHDERAILPLKILAPSLPFMAISACFRGYFFAVRQVIKTASEQLLEQIIEMIIFVSLIGSMLPKGLEYACCAIVIGTTIAEFASCFYSYFLYKNDIKKYNIKSTFNKNKIYKNIALISIPVTLSSSLRSGLNTIENILIPTGLQKCGMSETKSLSGYGLINGMVMPIIGFPSVLLFSFALLLIPEISEANAVHHTKNISYITKRVLHITFIYSIMVSGILLFFSNDFGISIYRNNEAGLYISLLSPIIPLIYMDNVVDGMLKGLNEQIHYLSYNIIDSFLRVILIIILLPRYGIRGLIIVMFFSAILNSSLSLFRLLKVTSININLIDWIIKPIISVIIVCLAIDQFMSMQIIEFPSIITKLIFEITISITLYLCILFIMGSINKEQINWVKGYLIRTN